MSAEKAKPNIQVNADAPPAGVELDPRHRLLIWRSEYGARPAQ